MRERIADIHDTCTTERPARRSTCHGANAEDEAWHAAELFTKADDDEGWAIWRKFPDVIRERQFSPNP